MSELIARIAKLSIAERILLVQEILSTITEESEKELTIIQKKELDKRSESYKNGNAKTISWENIEGKLIERYGL